MKPVFPIVTALASAISFGLVSVPAFAADASFENSPEGWQMLGEQTVKQLRRQIPNVRYAKNVILFVGDGMGVSTVTAARILEGQMQGRDGEINRLAFETMPNLAHAVTASANQQTSDSAPTATAMVTGVKANEGAIAVDQNTAHDETDAGVVAAHSLKTILERAEERGMSTGVVTTTRITHATPAVNYAHIGNRDWEGNYQLPAGATVKDIAAQLIDFPYGDGLEVALGGGRTQFYTNQETDPEYPNQKGRRTDGRSLYQEWDKDGTAPGYAYVWNKNQFDAIDPGSTDHLLGLFERSHMHYEADRALDPAGEPSLSEMTKKAIEILSKNKKGYYLMVEGGRIDHAHHASNAYRALTDTIAMSEAVKTALEMTSSKNTLILVTADHSHVFTIAGYPKRGNPILGKVVAANETEPTLDLLGLPYTTVSYANGPGYVGASFSDAAKKKPLQGAGSKTFTPNLSNGAGSEGHSPVAYDPATGRPDLSATDTADPSYLQEGMVPLSAETHAGEDVAIYASGPQAHLVRGTLEQNVIYHVMAAALRMK
ncbi:alkaline phosphatase [Methylococcus geothermalis]|uniref:Alkaline phosphatase n=1 Tax=Methylococcus geothermalis TaxID=2681310 RepID=A0A858Q4I1_9GAMM|nr:alkaline phosphatase [Methylococcus geothermalis]QJD28713.1 alkaline phosphatase [Methylococcus geothermalis]